MKPIPRRLDSSELHPDRSDYNNLLAAVEELQHAQVCTDDDAPADISGIPGQLLARASAPRDVSAWEAMAVDGLAVEPPEGVAISPILKLRDPKPGDAHIVVALAPMPASHVGRVVVAGLAWCKAKIVNKDDSYVTIGAEGKPETAAGGGWGWLVMPAPGTAEPSGSSEGKDEDEEQLCLVRLPVGVGGVRFGVVSERPSGGGGPVTWTPATVDANGNWVASGDPETAVAPRLN